MTQDEKDKLIELFADEQRWCRNNDAENRDGQAVHYDDVQAVSWDIVGGVCHLFGWKRAFKLFEPLSRCLAGRRLARFPNRNPEISAMTSLLNFNDAENTTHGEVMARLHELPVWSGRRLSL